MAFTAPDANGVITQTGRDLDLSGLAVNGGVTITTDAGVTYYDFGTNRLYVQGTLFHDPEKEVAIFHHSSTTTANPASCAIRVDLGANSWKTITLWEKDADGYLVATFAAHGYLVGDAIRIRSTTNSQLEQRMHRIRSVTADTVTLESSTNWSIPPANGQMTIKACYNYGKEFTNAGNTRYARGTGIFITGTSTTNYHPNEAGFSLLALNGLLWARGGTIVSHRPFDLRGDVDIIDLTLVGTRMLENRGFGKGAVKNLTFVNVGTTGMASLEEKGFTLLQGAFFELFGDSYDEFELLDLDASKNTEDYEVGHSTNIQYHHRDWIILNSATGSKVRGLWRSSPNNQRGVMVVKKEVSLNLKDANSTPISEAKVYLQDNPSAYAKNAIFASPTTVAYSGDATKTLGILNPDGTMTYDYTGAITYEYTSDSNGDVPKFAVTTATQILEFDSNDTSAMDSNGGTYSIPSFSSQWRETDNATPAYSDWDTDRFGGFYKVDRRSDSNSAADDFTFKFASYEHSLSQSKQALKGLGELQVNWVMFDDTSLTETNKATVDAYTTIDSSDQFYDRAKSYLYDNYAGETATIVTRNGTIINAGSYNVVVDASAASVFAFDGSTITIKATQFIGNITSSGTFTLLNGAEILGTYGATTVLPWTVTNIEAGSTIQIYNVTQAIEIENYITSGTAGTKITATGSYSSSEATAGDTIRLRITCQAGVTALIPFESFGVATAAGITFRADQVADTIYNTNNIDGSAITGITVTADYTNIQIDVDDNVAPYEITAQQIYNFYAYIITTTQGIANFYGAITPVNNMNYRINSSVVALKIQNTGTTDVVINGGRLYRDDNVSIIDTNSGTGAGTGSLVHDTGFLLQYIQPQVESAVSTIETDVASIKKKTNLISALV
jgi:hypothetical protein